MINTECNLTDNLLNADLDAGPGDDMPEEAREVRDDG
jgi:hypothetical protein